MATLTRRKWSEQHVDDVVEHYWGLFGRDGAITFSASPKPRFDGTEHAVIDGTPWIGWGIWSHIPSMRHVDEEFHDHSTAPCPLLEGIPCCGSGSVLQARELVVAWGAAGRNDDLIWSELEERYPTWIAKEVRVP